MGKRFQKFFRVTKGFLLLRFVVAIAVSVIYIFIAAGMQFTFVKFFGESAFNYILGGLLSLMLGVVACKIIGSIFFMFIKGWHVAALAYVDKIEKSGASALDVGVRAFFKNLVSFGAVYGLRSILKNVLADFKVQLWRISDDIPFVQSLKRFANHPAVEYLANDILHYSFDAVVYYIVGHPTEEINEIPETALEAVKKYLYCIPSILVSSVQTYILFRLLPVIAKYMVLLWVFLTQGFVAGVLLSVLMYPIFYILDNSFFDPITMMIFVAAYSKKCNKTFDSSDPVVVAVDEILNSTSSPSEEEAPTSTDDKPDRRKRKQKEQKADTTSTGVQPTTGEDFVDVEDVDGSFAPDVELPGSAGFMSASMEDLVNRLSALQGMQNSGRSKPPGSQFGFPQGGTDTDLPASSVQTGWRQSTDGGALGGFSPHVSTERPPNPFSVLKDQTADGLDDDPLAGMYGSDDSGETDV